MVDFLISVFIKKEGNAARESFGVLASVVGIVCNVFLFALKFILGLVSASIAVCADAFNNLSDAGSALVTLLGFKLAAKPADKEHPFGHGRYEYISGFIIAVIIMLVGFEFIKSAVSKIFEPEPIIFSWVVVMGLLASILVKLWLTFFNKKIAQKVGSKTIEASAADSISDVLSTSVTLIAIIASRFTDIPIDGYMGIIVSCFVLYAGYSIARDTLSTLLGHAPDPNLVSKIREEVCAYDGILGVHDIIVHDYGPGRIFTSLHAEVSCDTDIMESHALIDCIEEELSKKMGIDILIHMDPLDISCPITERLRDEVSQILHEVDEKFGMHDFRVVMSGEKANVIFDLAVPIDDRRTNDEILSLVCKCAPQYNFKITIDRTY